ncbi:MULTISPECIES: LuxR C-terminal-related transcriptional regulator [Microbulbifer]|uniref:LuxR C-terminal-related transcriptional regulator n=1 Tax=Microbulbifer TaxID=48073 RepID=UPI001E515A9F|nr:MULTISPECIES: LuxR C-terminal-related transcriptional regulator [Microbulbifer]UHQ53756.1 LuxR C-terminal-related transcriptional regulator [Microbulbifer sp. YPW16]
MKPDTQLLKAVWESSRQHLSDTHVGLERYDLDNLVSSVFSSGPFYFYVVDFKTFHLDYVSPSITAIHGLQPETVTFQDILDCVHPDDMGFVSRAEQRAIEIVYERIPPEKRKLYKISYCFRFRTADGSYQLFNHQAIMLTEDENNRLSKSLNIHTNISHLSSESNHRLSVIGMLGEPSFLNIEIENEAPVPAASQPLFTDREMEVIRLLSQGMTSREIAARLYIAVDTVKNHRKNIMKKSACKNVGQLITKCITQGLL